MPILIRDYEITARLNSISRRRDSAERLFGLILPRDGYRAGAAAWQPRGRAATALYNRLFETDAELAQWAIEKGTTNHVFHSTATVKVAGDLAGGLRSGFKGRRNEANVHSRQCFHGDLDCGETKPYLQFEHAKAAIGH